MLHESPLACWSYLGFPAITVNAGLSDENLSLGLQLVGPSKQDYELMRLGAWCEEVLGLLPAPVAGSMPQGESDGMSLIDSERLAG